MTQIYAKNQSVNGSRSLVDIAEENIINLLRSNKFGIGDVIPKEFELAETLGVSRTVVREALTRLRTLGLVVSKRKKGTVLATPDFLGTMERQVNPAVLDANTLRDIFELRLIIEMGMVDTLYKKVTPEDIELLREIAGSEPCTDTCKGFRIEHELEFHGKLYELTGNKTMTSLQNILLPVFNHVYVNSLLEEPTKMKRYSTHIEVVESLANGTLEEFREVMRKHFINHFLRLDLGATETERN